VDALATLCQRYWYPLYAYARRRTGDSTQAQDLTQEFFARVLEKGVLQTATPERGRFRSFLLVAMKNFLSSEWEKDQAAKRGGGRRVLSLDFDSGESKFRLEPSHGLTPERLFERQWTLQLLDHVMQRLEGEFAATGKSKQFAVLKEFLAGTREGLSYEAAAAELSMGEQGTRQAASRLRKRYRELLREEVAHTVEREADVEEELQSLFRSLE
jgi:RNA polymerase sigma-70 factor (ECF subfamily)